MQKLVHERLLDNFDTSGVITLLLDLINKSNVYLTNPDRKVLLLTSVAAYVEKMLKIFGLITEEDQAEHAKNIARPIVQQICDFRNEVRTAAKVRVYFYGHTQWKCTDRRLFLGAEECRGSSVDHWKVFGKEVKFYFHFCIGVLQEFIVVLVSNKFYH